MSGPPPRHLGTDDPMPAHGIARQPAPMDPRHSGRTAIVTGAASGIGRATALRLGREGCERVVIVDLSADRLAEVAAEVTGAVPIPGDVRMTEVIDAAVDACAGRIDVLVNNAGIMDYFLPVDSLDDQTWEHVMAVNVTAVMRMCRRVVPVMRAQTSGVVVTVSSIAGLTGGAAGFAYTASKHALVGMTRNMAALYAAEGIRSVAVCPGGVDTNIREHGAVPREPWVYERLAATSFPRGQRVADADEIAAVISWLASDEASDVNGIAMPVDAGWTAM